MRSSEAARPLEAPGGAPRVLLIDNFDSFTYNLVDALRVLGAEVVVVRNDGVDVDSDVRRALAQPPSHLLISPGPGHPREAALSLALLERLGGAVPTLGVCLGHQAMAHRLGGRVVRAGRLMHGKASWIHHDGSGLFAGLPSPLRMGRYHSLIVAPEGLPAELVANAWSEDGEIMGLRAMDGRSHGLQFHPESVLSPEGPRLLAAFLGLGASAAWPLPSGSAAPTLRATGPAAAP